MGEYIQSTSLDYASHKIIIRNMSNYKNILKSRAEQFKALGNPHRLALFHKLANCCPTGTACSIDSASRYCVGELSDDLELAPSTISHHLKELNRAGLIQMERQGKNVMCWIEPAVLEQLEQFFAGSHLNQDRRTGT